jgi:hypothetical protein
MSLSQELEVSPLRVSPSQLGVYKSCPQMWKYGYIDKLQRKGNRKQYFDIGTYFHELSHVYYQLLRMNHEPGGDFVLNAMRSRIESDLTGVTQENLEVMATVMPLVTKYITYQSPKIDKGIKVIGVEYEFFVPFGNVVLHGIIDLLYRNSRGVLCIRDHKTGQQLLYALAMSIEFNEPVHVVDLSFTNTHVYKTKQPPVNELFERYLYEHNENSLRVFGENLLEITNKMVASPTHRRYSAECAGCQFFQLCTSETRGLPTDLIIASNYEKRPEHNVDSGDSSGTATDAEENSSGPETNSVLSIDLSGWNISGITS